MNEPLLPLSCDVLVIGAGPSGSACAQMLARGGLQVLLVDQHDFPRDKVCGDGLIPDSHAALKRLGVYDEVAALATPVQHVRCVGPRGGFIDVPGNLSVLPRKTLDHILVRAAQRAGARLLTPLRFEAPLLDEGQRVVGASFKRLGTAEGAAPHDIHAKWVVLATGAVPQGLTAAGLCERHTPSGVALRGYVRHEGLVGKITQLQIVWHPRLRGGYGWIFPAPDGVFNIGAGHTGSHARHDRGEAPKTHVNLRRMLEDFCDVHEPARKLMTEGALVGEFKGAPLRCSLLGASWSRAGMIATGEAIGSTYAFSGEGIGKAMETGLLAAEAILADDGSCEANVRRKYEALVAALRPRFALYSRAAFVNTSPTLMSLIVWKASRSELLRERMSDVLAETRNPGSLFTPKGLWRFLTI